MGQQTDARIREWQQRAGITPAEGRRAATLERMSQLAFDLIKVIELERSGIRDGDGYWHGSDPLASIIGNLIEAQYGDRHLEIDSNTTPTTAMLERDLNR